jgi:hypothetical protein
MVLAFRMIHSSGKLIIECFACGNIVRIRFRFTYVGHDGLSHIASRSILSMTSSNAARSQSNIYLDDPDCYHQYQTLAGKYSVSTMNVPSTVSAAADTTGLSYARGMKSATSMQQLKGSTNRQSHIRDSSTMMDHDDQSSHQEKSTLSIPDVYQQQLMNERLMCIQQMMASGQNITSMFNDDPQFVQQIMSCLSSGGFYQQHHDDPDVIEIMDE